MSRESVSRRDFLATSAAAALLGATASAATVADSYGMRLPNATTAKAKPPIGIELYALRTEIARDLPNTLRQTKAMGYDIVEFYAPYTKWTAQYAKEVRKMMDDLGLKCRSTHNDFESMQSAPPLHKCAELNQILGSRYMVLASPPSANLAGESPFPEVGSYLKYMVEQLWLTIAILEPLGIAAGYHNHADEWRVSMPNGVRAMDYIADNTPDSFMLQLDVGTCVQAGADPVAWVKAHKGRIKSVHLKDWAPGADADEKGYRVLFGEGTVQWTPLIAALESGGGVEYYLMEQEGSRFSEFETAKRCLDSWKTLRKGA